MPGIDYTLGMKTSGFDAGVKGALGKLASIGKAAAVATAAAGAAAGAGAAAIIAKSIGKAADMETLRTAFIPLLGGIQQARDRMAELSRFAASTPFELPEIATASKTLETLTRGALSTGKGLTLVGDLAAASNQPFSDLAVQVGRLYDGLQSGRPVGEVMMRLQELGAITGETRARLESMNEGGAGAEAWIEAERALGRFSGSMKLQSSTWNGLMSTLRDTISDTMARFGEPIMDALKPYLEGAIARMESFRATAERIGERIGQAVRLVSAAFAEGRMMELAGVSLKLGFIDAVNTLAKGVQAAMAAAGAGLEASGIPRILTSLFSGIGDLLGSKLKAAAADFMSAIGRSGAAADLRAGSRADALRSENYFTMTAAALSMADPAAGIQAAIEKFNSAFAALPELIDSTAARESFNETLAGLRARANADAEAQRRRQEDIVAQVVAPQAGIPQLAATPAAAAQAARQVQADRLRQIGGYVGTGMSAAKDRIAEKTEQWTRESARYLERLVQHATAPKPAAQAGGAAF